MGTIGVIDYGAGNLQSVANALERLELPWRLCAAPADLEGCDRMLLPGVGHFGAAARNLAETGLAKALRRRATDGTPVLGICLGMQLLLESSDEAPGASGLGLLAGRCTRLATPRVPHMGWNRVRWGRPFFGRTQPCEYYYFAHTFAAQPCEPIDRLAEAEYGDVTVPAAIGRDLVTGVQFHPEKSAAAGLELLRRFGRC